MKILLLGTCQMMSYDTILRASNLGDLTILRFNEVKAEQHSSTWYDQFDMVLTHNEAKNLPPVWSAIQSHRNLVLIPVLFFNGFTPDDEIAMPMRPGSGPAMMSRIAVGAFRTGLHRDEAMELYSPVFCDFMGYPATLASARQFLITRFAPTIPNIEQLYASWFARGPFFFTSNHPRLFVVEDILRETLRNCSGIELPRHLSEVCNDPLAEFLVSPQMNHPHAVNLVTSPTHLRREGSKTMTCRAFLDRCYDLLEQNRATIVFDPGQSRTFDAALAKWRASKLNPAVDPVSNPYKKQPDRAFWSRAVARPNRAAVQPIGTTRPLIDKATKVATAGSCFAQHVARAMVADGLNYYVAEAAPAEMDVTLAAERGYGLFSARYGNIYSSRQLLQLMQRAYGEFDPIESAWKVQDGYVDPFRPNIGEVFPNPEAVVTARAAHLAKVREMFENLDLFVFTMGLTEGWIDRRDGAAFPVAPAAVSAAIDPASFGFLNSDHTAIHREMTAFLRHLARVNPAARVVLTVSPVPLIATFTDSDALSATTYSKSVLRAVAGDLAQQFDHVSYFPSFEIITGNHARGAYFEDDLRSVRPEGVDHVMRVFREVLVIRDQPQASVPPTLANAEADPEYLRQANVVCDEEMLVR